MGLLLLLSQMLLPSLAMDTMADMATVATEAMAMVDMVTTAIMGRGLLMLMLTTAMEDTEDMVMDMVMAMDMVTAMATTARDLQMPTTATVMAMVMDTVMAMVMVMAMDTTDKKEGW